MKLSLLFASFLFACAAPSLASPCAAGTLATYIGLGSGGCTVGDNTLSNFAPLGGMFGAMQIDPSAVTITPSGNSFNPGLTASVNFTATAGNSGEINFTYTISGTSYVSETVTLSNASEDSTDGGAVTDVQNYCENGQFTDPNTLTCNGYNSGGTALADGFMNQDTITFDPPAFLNIIDDLSIDGGAMTSSTGGTISDQFTSIPEPAAVVVTALGLCPLFLLRSRFARRG